MLSCMEPEALKNRVWQNLDTHMSWFLIKYVGLKK